MQKSLLRKEFRAKRRALSPRQQKAASERFIKRLIRHPLYRRAKTIALYWPNDGELDLRSLVKTITKHHKTALLPIIAPSKHSRSLSFGSAHGPFHKNRFAINEPSKSHGIFQVDLLIMPLVAFDAHKRRLGMGGGFYDRTLAHKANTPRIAAAHQCQFFAGSLPFDAWDMPVHDILAV